MPGSVSNAAPLTVMPHSLCSAFAQSRMFAINEKEYKNGELERGKLTLTSRKSWQISKMLSPYELGELQSFYKLHNGPHKPFYFYDPWESGFTHDPTGVQTLGRYTVRFDSGWQQTSSVARNTASFTLIQLA